MMQSQQNKAAGGWMDTILNLIPGRKQQSADEPSEEAIKRTHEFLRCDLLSKCSLHYCTPELPFSRCILLIEPPLPTDRFCSTPSSTTLCLNVLHLRPGVIAFYTSKELERSLGIGMDQRQQFHISNIEFRSL